VGLTVSTELGRTIVEGAQELGHQAVLVALSLGQLEVRVGDARQILRFIDAVALSPHLSQAASIAASAITTLWVTDIESPGARSSKPTF
jgi:hypothetical protein